MSHANRLPVDPSNEDGVNLKKIALVGIVSLVIFGLSALVAWIILERDTAAFVEANGERVTPAGISQAEIGIVDMPVFDGDDRLAQWTAAKKKRLSSYGWANRAKGQIHIPIDKAMEQVISETAAAPPPVTPR